MKTKAIYLKIQWNLDKSIQRTEEGKMRKKTFYSVNICYEGQEFTINAFKSGIFPSKPSQEKGLKILSSKYIL